jgi:hypothetical protein
MSTRFRIVIFILLFISCEKFDWNNPYDPECPKDLFTPSSPGVTMEGNSVKLTWSQQNDNISSFALFRRAEGESITTLSQIQKNTTQYVDANITPGKKYTYYVVAVAGTNSSDTIKAEIVPVFPVTISTGAVTELTETSAKLSGNITSAGGGTVTSRGICWSTTPSPTVNNSKTTEGTGVGVFTSTLVNLLAGTTYYARAYGENSRGISYGSEVVFTTRGLPTLTTSAVSNITANTANSGGTINGDGGAPITVKGLVWSTLPNPTVDLATKTNEGAGSSSFTSSLLGLAPNVKYYVRAYATNANGTAYGQEISFSTLPPSLSALTTNLVSSITANSAISGGNITADGGSPVTARGICWNTNGSPTIANTRTQDGSGTGAFTSSMSGLTPLTTYFVRAYATNATGTSYGQEISFRTVPPSLPTLTINLVSSITTTSAISGGNVSSDGGSPVTVRGVCWNTIGSPTAFDTRTQDGSGTGAFTSFMTGLTPNTTYFVRAYATNVAGTSYGGQTSFKTQANFETCSITGVTNGTTYNMQAPVAGSIFTSGDLYKITMASNIFAFGQATEVAIYRNETKVYSYGSFLVFNESPGNTRTFPIPSGMTPSTCYTIRVTRPEGLNTVVYVTPQFEIR